MPTEPAFIRKLATALTPIRDFSQAIPSEDAAAAFFHDAVFASCCPTCGGRSVRHGKQIACARCRQRRSLTANTPLRNTKLPLRHWLAAIWHLHVDTVSISSRHFAHRYDARVMTAWKLLHRVRDAFEHHVPKTSGPRRQLLGRRSSSNRAEVTLVDEDGLAATQLETSASTTSPPQTSWHHGYLHAWIVSLFRGVSRTHLTRYLDEYVARARRLSAA